MRRRVTTCMLMILMLLCGCANQNTTDNIAAFSGYSGEVVLYSSLQEQQLEALKEAFKEKYPEITMHYYFADSGTLFTRLTSEVQIDNIQADLIWTGDPADYIKMRDNRILAPYISPQAINIAPEFMDDQHYYVGARITNSVIIYNTDLLSEEEAPHSWNELLDAKWKGKLLMADPYSAGNAEYFVGAMMETPIYGARFFEGLRNNECSLESGTMATHLRVATGEYTLGIGLDYVVSNLQNEGYPIAAVYPETDLVFMPCPVGLVAGAPNERNGKLLYDFILSKEGQNVLIASGLHSVRQDIGEGVLSCNSLLENGLYMDNTTIAHNSSQNLLYFDRIFFK